MTFNANEALKPYVNMTKGWAKQAGTKPTGEALATVHALGARPGKQAMALAMALRPEGVTGPQIVLACGAPQLNKMRDTAAKGLVKFVAMPITEAGHKVYRIELTAKGTAKVDKAKAAPADADTKAAKPRKAAKPSKPKADKAAPAVTTAPAAPADAAPAV